MPPDIYESVKAHCHAKLRELFICVASPIDGPGKKDFGDVDIIVAWPKQQYEDTIAALEAVKTALEAHRAILEKTQTSSNFAVRWPDDGLSIGPSERFIQVDVRICDTLERLQWMLFKHAHGDIWNLVGSTIRPYGLTIDDGAFYIRIPEIEYVNRKRARIFLTAEPAEVLDFLGLPIGDFWDVPFPSLWNMFQYAAQCRLFWVQPNAVQDAVQSGFESAVVDGIKSDRAALKSNDRRRMDQRPGFRAWIEDFVADCRQKGLYSQRPTTREDVTQETLCRFQVRDEYNSRRDDFLRERQKERIVKFIKTSAAPATPEDPKSITYRSSQIKAMKRVLFEGDQRYGILAPSSITDNNGFYDEDRVNTFLQEQAKSIGDAALALHHQGYQRFKQAEAEKREAEVSSVFQG